MIPPPAANHPNGPHGSNALAFPASPWALSAIPLPPPRVDPTLGSQHFVPRTAVVLRHTLLRFEYWLSPSGLLREWIRRCLLLAVFVAIPALCVAPMVTTLLEHLTAWSAALLEICSNLAQIPGRLSAGVLIALAGGLLLRWLLRH